MCSAAHQLTLRLQIWAMHTMTPMKMAQARTPMRETQTRRLPVACTAAGLAPLPLTTCCHACGCQITLAKNRGYFLAPWG